MPLLRRCTLTARASSWSTWMIASSLCQCRRARSCWLPLCVPLMAGIFAQTVIFGATSTGIGLATDLQRGLVDRFRSLPMAKSAVLTGRTLSDLVRNTFVVLVMWTVGLLVGFRPQGPFISWVAAAAFLLPAGC